MGHAVLHNNALFCAHCHACNFIKDVPPWRIDRYVTIDVLMWVEFAVFGVMQAIMFGKNFGGLAVNNIRN